VGRGWRIFGTTAVLGISVLFLASHTPAFVWGTFLAFVACLALLYICSDRIRQAQALGGLAQMEDRLVGSWLGRFFAGRWGRGIAEQELEAHLDAQRRERAIALAQRFDLVGHGALYLDGVQGPEAAADFAEACGHAALAKEFHVSAYQRHLAAGRIAQAAEAADRGDLYAEAHQAWHEVRDGAGVLRAARLSERLGHPRTAIRDFVTAGHGGDALRVAQARGLEEEFLEAAEVSPEPAIWRIAGELCLEREQFRPAVGFLRRAGDLRMTLLAAKRGGLDDVVREITGILERRAEEERKSSLPGGYWGSA
jgi:hypothetical protein